MPFPTLLRVIPSILSLIGLIAAGEVRCQPSGRGAARDLAAAGVTNPRLEHKVDPVYPQEAREARLEAVIILQAMIRKDGRIEPGSIDFLKCSVRRDEEQEAEEALKGWCEDFCEATTTAVTQWRYAPALQDGEPVDVYFTVVVAFDLD